MSEKKQWQTVAQPSIKGGAYGLLEQDGNNNHYRLTYRDATKNELVVILWSAEKINAESWYHPTRVDIKKETDKTTKTQDPTNPKAEEWKELKTHTESLNERVVGTANTMIAAYTQAREKAPLNMYVNVIEDEAVRKRLKEDMEMFGKTETQAMSWMNNNIKPTLTNLWFSTNSVAATYLVNSIRIQNEFKFPDSAAWDYTFTISPATSDLSPLGSTQIKIDAIAQWYVEIITSQIAHDLEQDYLIAINSDGKKLWSSINVNETGKYDKTIESIISQIQVWYSWYSFIDEIRSRIYEKLKAKNLYCDMRNAFEGMKDNNNKISSHKIPIRVQSSK